MSKTKLLVVAIFVEERKELPFTRSCEPYLHLSSRSSDIKKLLSCCDGLVLETAFKTETKSVGFFLSFFVSRRRSFGTSLVSREMDFAFLISFLKCFRQHILNIGEYSNVLLCCAFPLMYILWEK